MTTPSVYIPGGDYSLSAYNYEAGSVSSSTIQADNQGRLQIETRGGMGDEIGISGHGLPPAVLFLTDTLIENLYIESGKTISLSFKVINLSPSRMDSVVFSCRSGNAEAINIVSSPKAYNLDPGEVTLLEDLVTLTGHFTSRNKNLAYLHLGYQHKGITSPRERIIQVHIIDSLKKVSADNVMIFDGRTEQLPVYRYDWGDWDERVRPETISEGHGNGNGIAEPGEIFSVWIRIASGEAPDDLDTWHPVTPIGGRGSMEIHVDNVREHLFSTGRPLLSAQMRLPAINSKNQTGMLNVQSELNWMYPAHDCHRGSVDRIYIHYFQVPITKQ